MRIALYQPDIPQNAGTILRMAACLGLSVDIIGPAGFDYSDKALKRAGLDYLPTATLVAHTSWQSFLDTFEAESPPRIVLLTTKGTLAYTSFTFQPDDILLLGRESAGVPDDVHARADARLVIPLMPGLRSLNVAVATAMVTGEALRQTNRFPVP